MKQERFSQDIQKVNLARALIREKIDSPPCSALLLDSGGGWSGTTEDSYTWFGQPEFRISFREGVTRIENSSGDCDLNCHPLEFLETVLSEGHIAVGYIGYECSAFTQDGFSPTRLKEGFRFPDMHFLCFKAEDVKSGRISELSLDCVGEANLSINTGSYECPAVSKDRKSTRLNSSHMSESRMPSSA